MLAEWWKEASVQLITESPSLFWWGIKMNEGGGGYKHYFIFFESWKTKCNLGRLCGGRISYKKKKQEIKSARADLTDSLGETMLCALCAARIRTVDARVIHISCGLFELPHSPSLFCLFVSSKFTNGQMCSFLLHRLSGWAVWRLRTCLKWEAVKPSQKYIDSGSPDDNIFIIMTHFSFVGLSVGFAVLSLCSIWIISFDANMSWILNLVSGESVSVSQRAHNASGGTPLHALGSPEAFSCNSHLQPLLQLPKPFMMLLLLRAVKVILPASTPGPSQPQSGVWAVQDFTLSQASVRPHQLVFGLLWQWNLQWIGNKCFLSVSIWSWTQLRCFQALMHVVGGLHYVVYLYWLFGHF